MITAHLPSGYILSRIWPPKSKGLLAAALLGAVFPDFDMAWFHLVDNRAFHHHYYWVHIPGFWVLVALATLPILRLSAPRALPYAALFLTAIFLHLILDTLAGEIAWAWPYDRTLYALVTVPATQSHWVWSFVFHWTFLAEIMIWISAAFLYLTRRNA